jgi:DNA-binding response OmpR family regulator
MKVNCVCMIRGTMMKQTMVLVVDDDPQMQRLVVRNLQLEGYATLTAANGQEGVERVREQTPDLILMDVMMPKMDGFTACQQIRSFSLIPIIMLTARGRDEDKVRGLDAGADDYLTKPFSVEELLARVRAVLRRADYRQEAAQATPATLTIGDITIDFSQHLVQRDGEEIALTPTEYHLFAYLVENAGRVLTQTMLLEQVWGQEYANEYHMLQVNINRLRRKVEADPAHPRYILTKSGVGYSFARPSA